MIEEIQNPKRNALDDIGAILLLGIKRLMLKEKGETSEILLDFQRK